MKTPYEVSLTYPHPVGNSPYDIKLGYVSHLLLEDHC